LTGGGTETVKVLIPTVLRRATHGEAEIYVTATSISECIEKLEERFPGLRERLCDAEGEIRRFVNIYVNGEDVRFLAGLATPVGPEDEISIIPAVSGG
jgi:molybdopterin converting factor small subunit